VVFTTCSFLFSFLLFLDVLNWYFSGALSCVAPSRQHKTDFMLIFHCNKCVMITAPERQHNTTFISLYRYNTTLPLYHCIVTTQHCLYIIVSLHHNTAFLSLYRYNTTLPLYHCIVTTQHCLYIIVSLQLRFFYYTGREHSLWSLQFRGGFFVIVVIWMLCCNGV
jgi:hypothetical protein